MVLYTLGHIHTHRCIFSIFLLVLLLTCLFRTFLRMALGCIMDLHLQPQGAVWLFLQIIGPPARVLTVTDYCKDSMLGSIGLPFLLAGFLSQKYSKCMVAHSVGPNLLARIFITITCILCYNLSARQYSHQHLMSVTPLRLKGRVQSTNFSTLSTLICAYVSYLHSSVCLLCVQFSLYPSTASVQFFCTL